MTAVVAASLLATIETRARAEAPSSSSFEPGPEAAPPERVPLVLDVEGPVRIVANGATLRCHGPCAVEVERGVVTIHTDTVSRELYVEGPSRVDATRGVPALRTGGLALLIGGAAIAVAALVIPLVVCRSNREVDAYGRVLDHNPCRDVSDGVKVAWIMGAGVGLVGALVGGIVYSTAGPSLRLTPTSTAGVATAHVPARPRFELVPVLRTSRDVDRGYATVAAEAGLAIRLSGW